MFVSRICQLFNNKFVHCRLKSIFLKRWQNISYMLFSYLQSGCGTRGKYSQKHHSLHQLCWLDGCSLGRPTSCDRKDCFSISGVTPASDSEDDLTTQVVKMSLTTNTLTTLTQSCKKNNWYSCVQTICHPVFMLMHVISKLESNLSKKGRKELK